MRISRVKVRRVGAGEDGGAWANALADGSWHSGAQLLKEDDEAWVRRALVGGRDVVIKCRPIWRSQDRMKLLFGVGRGDRHWRGAMWLQSHALSTARPLALATAEVDGIRAELLVTDFIDARSVLERLAALDLGIRDQHKVCRNLGRLIAGLVKQGRYNRDGKPSNLLVTHELEIATIDAVAIRQVGPATHTRLVEMLANLVIEPIGVGVEPRRALKARVIKEVVDALNTDPRRAHVERLELWWHAGERVQAHGDMKPRVNPLAQAEGR